MFSRITRELDPGIANFRNLSQDWFLLGAIGDLNGEHPMLINPLILNSAERPLKRPLGIFLHLASNLHLLLYLLSATTFEFYTHIFVAKSTIKCQATCKRTQQLPAWLGQQIWELLRPCWQWCANAHVTTPNNVGLSRVLVYHAELLHCCLQGDHV